MHRTHLDDRGSRNSIMQNSVKPPWYKRKYIVDRSFQLGLMLKAGLYSVLGMLILSVGIFYPLVGDLKQGSESASASEAMLYLHKHFWPVALLCVALALLLSVHHSHRIAGPLVRIKKELRSLGEGLISDRLVTRRRDYLKQEVVILNEMMESVAQATDRIKSLESDLGQQIRKCSELLPDYDHEELKRAFAELERKSQALHAGVGHFRREGEESNVKPAETFSDELVAG